jgi:23S rRNA (guanine745-N1)-methyltransferase
MVTLLCPVRGCGLPLDRKGATFECERRHSFDVARSGYINLLQATDRRSSRPGDSPEALAARRRFLEQGFETHVVEAVLAEIEHLGLAHQARLLDVGCGTGFYIGAIGAAHDVDCHGVDISSTAIDLAARTYPRCAWIVANADRFLPFPDGVFDIILSITSRRNASEFRRVVRPSGSLLVVVPAADDLVELREAILGRGVVESRVDSVVHDLRSEFALVRRTEVREQVFLDSQAALDALAATYRGGRESQRDRVASLEGLLVTLSRDVLVFRAVAQD